jgi:hypothetical protein
MRIFHEMIADDVLTDTTTHFCRIQWPAVLGNFETFRVMVVADHVSGSPNPTLNVSLSDTPDISDLIALPGAPTNYVISGATLTAGQVTVVQGGVGPADPNPTSYASYIFYTLLGTGTIGAHVRIWVTGRGRA